MICLKPWPPPRSTSNVPVPDLLRMFFSMSSFDDLFYNNLHVPWYRYSVRYVIYKKSYTFSSKVESIQPSRAKKTCCPRLFLISYLLHVSNPVTTEWTNAYKAVHLTTFYAGLLVHGSLVWWCEGQRRAVFGIIFLNCSMILTHYRTIMIVV